MKEVSDTILSYLGKSEDFTEYVEGEPFTTKDKKVDVTKAKRDLDHNPVVKLADGLPKTIEWMKAVYKGAGSEPGRPGQLYAFL